MTTERTSCIAWYRKIRSSGNGYPSSIVVDLLIHRARENDLDIKEEEVWDVIDDRVNEGAEPETYSWVHLNKFRKFELHDRCFPWITEEELRTVVGELPSPTPRPEWEASRER